jgi:adenosylhomocysteine nucleosidase
VIALVGLAFEARIAAGPGVLVVCRGRGMSDLLRLAIGAGCRSIISFGVARGLAPDLIPGDCVVASAIIDYPAVRPTDPLWSRKLAEMIPDARHGPIMGVNSVVSDPADKRKLHASTRAVAVDMESHLVARLADAHGLAFAAVRVIIDPAHRVVPPAALLAMAPGGSTDVSAMLWEILVRPSQVSPLMRLATDAIAARTALVRLRRVLGASFSWEREVPLGPRCHRAEASPPRDAQGTTRSRSIYRRAIQAASPSRGLSRSPISEFIFRRCRASAARPIRPARAAGAAGSPILFFVMAMAGAAGRGGGRRRRRRRAMGSISTAPRLHERMDYLSR